MVLGHALPTGQFGNWSWAENRELLERIKLETLFGKSGEPNGGLWDVARQMFAKALDKRYRRLTGCH